jgi:hypothetical protein
LGVTIKTQFSPDALLLKRSFRFRKMFPGPHTGHMVYAHEASLKALHNKVAEFIRHTLTH